MTTETGTQNELFAALAKAQGQFKTVAASRHVNIRMKDGGSYSYNYATLASIMDMLRGPLASNGLSIAQLIAGDELITILGHSSGQSITSTVSLPRSSDIKGMGANLTYLRRYSITAIAGVAIDEEDDEAAADGKMEPKARQVSVQPPEAHTSPPQPKTVTPPAPTKINGDKGKVADDPMTLFWLAVGNAGLSKPEGARILSGENGDPVKAINIVTGIAQPIAE